MQPQQRKTQLLFNTQPLTAQPPNPVQGYQQQPKKQLHLHDESAEFVLNSAQQSTDRLQPPSSHLTKRSQQMMSQYSGMRTRAPSNNMADHHGGLISNFSQNGLTKYLATQKTDQVSSKVAEGQQYQTFNLATEMTLDAADKTNNRGKSQQATEPYIFRGRSSSIDVNMEKGRIFMKTRQAFASHIESINGSKMHDSLAKGYVSLPSSHNRSRSSIYTSSRQLPQVGAVNFPHKTAIPQSQKRSHNKFSKIMQKYQQGKSLDRNCQIIQANQDASILNAKIPNLGANLAFSMHKQNQIEHETSSVFASQSNNNHGISQGWRVIPKQGNDEAKQYSTGKDTFGTQFTRFRQKAKGLYMHRNSSSSQAAIDQKAVQIDDFRRSSEPRLASGASVLDTAEQSSAAKVSAPPDQQAQVSNQIFTQISQMSNTLLQADQDESEKLNKTDQTNSMESKIPIKKIIRKSQPDIEMNPHQFSESGIRKLLIENKKSRAESKLLPPNHESQSLSPTQQRMTTDFYNTSQSVIKQGQDFSSSQHNDDVSTNANARQTVDHIQKQFQSLQKMDYYEKEKDVSFVKKQDRITIDDRLNDFKQSKEQYVANPKIVIDQRTRKIKPLLRKKLTQTFLSRMETVEEKKLQEEKKLIKIAFDKTSSLNADQALHHFRNNVTTDPVDLKQLAVDAAIEGKARYKENRIAGQLEHIKDSLADVRQLIKGTIAELGHLDFDEVYSESDASDYRDEDVYHDIDNRIEERLQHQEDEEFGEECDLQEVACKSDTSSVDLSEEESEEENEEEEKADTQRSQKRERKILFKNRGKNNENQKNLTLKLHVYQQCVNQHEASVDIIKSKITSIRHKQVFEPAVQQKERQLRKIVTHIGNKTLNAFQMQRTINHELKKQKIKNQLNEKMTLMNQAVSLNTAGLGDMVETIVKNGTNQFHLYKNSSINEMSKKLFSEAKSLDMNEQFKSQVMAQRSIKIAERLKYYEISMMSHRETFRHVLQNDPMLVYCDQVFKSLELNLPLVTKQIGNKLVLTDYTLDTGHFQGLSEAIKRTKRPSIDQILFDNCGIDDYELSVLLNGFMELEYFTVFVYKQNQFKEKGLKAIQPILMKPDPMNLHELRLVNCETSPQWVEELVKFMVTYQVHLRSLSLVKMKVTGSTLARIARFVDESEHLQDLDLSWNNLLPQDFLPFYQVLAKDRNMRSINLSCNSLLDKADQNNDFKLELFSAIQLFQRQRAKALAHGLTEIQEVEIGQDCASQISHSFGQLIRFNKRIQTINLNNTGLNSQVLVSLVPFLRHAKSLLCLHLASNPGINEKVFNYYCERLKTLPQPTTKVQVICEPLGEITKEDKLTMTKSEIIMRKHKMKFWREWKAEEVARYMSNRYLRPLLMKTEAELRTDSKNLQITRKLGHKHRMPGSGRWLISDVKEADSCWACDGWTFTLYFWNRSIGQYNDLNTIGIDKKSKKHLVDTIRDKNPDSYVDHPELPIYFSTSTNWKGRPFMPLLDFIDSCCDVQQQPDYDNIALVQAQKTYNFAQLQSLTKEKQSIVKPFIAERKALLRSGFVKQRIGNAAKLIKDSLRYDNPRMINFELLDGQSEEMWVLPLFMKPGKNDQIIRTPINPEVVQQIKQGRKVELKPYQTQEDAVFDFHYRRSIVDIREAKIPNYAKQLKINEDDNKFKKKLSMFKDWQEDNQRILSQAFIHDSKYWKLKRFLGENKDYQRVQDMLKNHFEVLKEIFISNCVTSNSPPDLKRDHTYKFLVDSGCVDGHYLSRGIIDTHFKAANYEIVDSDDNADNALCRYEFMEFIVRIAKVRLLDPGIVGDIASAVLRLLNQFILPMRNNIIPWQIWRQQELWTKDIDQEIEVNLKQLRRLFDFIAKSDFRTKRNRLPGVNCTEPSIDQTIKVIASAKIPDINERLICQAFYLSKMTVVQENDISNVEYTYLHWPEFLEFICRLAQLKYLGSYQETQWTLTKKVRPILRQVFKLVGERWTKPPPFKEDISESDDEY